MLKVYLVSMVILMKEKYLLLSRYDGNIKESIVELVDLQSFELLHSWNPDINSIFEKS